MKEPDRVSLVAWCNIAGDHALQAALGLLLVTSMVHRVADEPITHENIGCVASTLRNSRESLRQRLRRAIITNVEPVAPHRPQSAQLRGRVIPAFRGFERVGQHHLGPFEQSRGVKQRYPKWDLQTHSEEIGR